MIFFLFIGISAAAPPVSGPQPLDLPSWFPSDSYPAEALRAKAQGTVAFEVEVDARGKPGACVVTRSSGHASLDSRTCELVGRNGRFRPATGPDGKKVASTFASKMSWQIPTTAPHSYRAVIVDIPQGGAKPQCRVEAAEIPPDEASACASALRKIAGQPDFARAFKRVTFVLNYSDKDLPPYPPDPSWGVPLSRLVSEQTRLAGSTYPIRCTTVIADGWSKGADACAGFSQRKRRLTAAEAAIAEVGRVEVSVFGVPR